MRSGQEYDLMAIQVSIKIPPHQVGQRNLAVLFRAAAPNEKTQA